METLLKYFPALKPEQINKFELLQKLYTDWNEKINIISRKDIEFLVEHHLLHSLALHFVMPLKEKSKILDLGTGGGLPGIPLAILYPDVSFVLIDGTGKKITVVNDIIRQLDLSNAEGRHIRAEELRGEKFDFVVTRAVAPLDKLVLWSRPLLKTVHRNILPNGLLTLKGGRLQAEIQALGKGEYVEVFPLKKYFDMPYYTEKMAVYVQG